MVHIYSSFVRFIIFCVIQNVLSSDIEVEVEQGTLAGELLMNVLNDTQYYSFKGIPYAKPPIGDLRFKAPEAPESWTGVRNATAHGDVCTQVDLLSNVYMGNESCLFLNVYTPCLNCTELLPVMFFIHGGGFLFGSGNVDSLGPDFFMRKDVVLVTINYRLDYLGFLCLDTEDVPGNAGLKDQNAALKWVNKNIANFGGNPANITIFGQSAGSAAVAYHVCSPMSSGLFQRAILQSGVPPMDCLIPYKSKERAFALGKKLGLETKNVTELYNFLLNVTADNLVNISTTIFAAEEVTAVPFRFEVISPVIEKDLGQERFVTDDPVNILKAGNISNIDILFGYTSAESLIMLQFYVDYGYIERYNSHPEMFVPSKISINATTDTIWDLSKQIINHYYGNKSVNVENMQEMIDYASHAYVTYDVHRYVQHFPDEINMYAYLFNGISDRNYYGNQGLEYGVVGASHFDDLMHLFDPKSLDLPIAENSTEYTIVEVITKVFTDFAKYGNPTPDTSLGITWPLATRTNFSFVEISTNLTISDASYYAEEMEFWKSIFEYANMTF